MAAGYVNVTIKDAGGTNRNVKMWSSDGTLTGDLQQAPYDPSVVLDTDLDDGVSGTLTTTSNSGAILASPGVGFVHALDVVTVSNMGGTATAVDLICNGTTRHTIPAAANGGGATIKFSGSLIGGDNQAWSAQCKTAGGSVIVSMTSYIRAA